MSLIGKGERLVSRLVGGGVGGDIGSSGPAAGDGGGALPHTPSSPADHFNVPSPQPPKNNQPSAPDKVLVQKLACAYFVAHYFKRIVETFTVHTFGHDTMPVFNLFKNCSYYYGFAAFIAYFVNHPAYTPPPVPQSLAAFALAALCQLANLRCHIILANLRKPGEKAYKIPSGFLFNYITCANYR